MVLMLPRLPALTTLEMLLVGGALAVVAALAPLPLYLLALMLFGLPHVLWELNWIRRTYRNCIPNAWWGVWALILLVQALARLGAWQGWVQGETTMVVDLVTLALLMMTVIALAYRQGGVRAWLVAGAALLLGYGLLWAVNHGDVVAVLVLLAIAHNFTPLLLVPPAQRFGDLSARRALSLLFTLPWLLAAFLWLLGTRAAPGGLWMPSEAAWLQPYLAQGFGAVLSGLVLAQCLHYYSVLRLLPTTLPVPSPRQWQLGAVLVSGGLTAYFVSDFMAARKLYAVAAGVHAWLEFPLILLLLRSKRDT
jgi:hypothetical protein